MKTIALAMGVAVVVLGILGISNAASLISLLGVGLFCLAFWALQMDK